MTRVVLATKNAGKVAELQRILTGFSLEGASYEPGPETGTSFAENALAKAREGVAQTGLPSVADDSGCSIRLSRCLPRFLVFTVTNFLVVWEVIFLLVSF